MFIRTFFYKKCKNISIRQHYGSNNKLIQMNNIPEIIPTIERCQFPNSLASGSKVSNDMYIIIPATAAIAIPTIICGKKKCNKIIPITAPKGSVMPDNAAYKVAYLFLPVA